MWFVPQIDKSSDDLTDDNDANDCHESGCWPHSLTPPVPPQHNNRWSAGAHCVHDWCTSKQHIHNSPAAFHFLSLFFRLESRRKLPCVSFFRPFKKETCGCIFWGSPKSVFRVLPAVFAALLVRLCTCTYNSYIHLFYFLDAIASPSTYPGQCSG